MVRKAFKNKGHYIDQTGCIYLFRNIDVLYIPIYTLSTHMYVAITHEKEAMNLNESKEEHMGGFGGRQEKGE